MMKFWGCFSAFMSLTFWRKTGEGGFLFVGIVMLVCVFGMALSEMIIEICQRKIQQIEEEKK